MRRAGVAIRVVNSRCPQIAAGSPQFQAQVYDMSKQGETDIPVASVLKGRLQKMVGGGDRPGVAATEH
eukprot:11006322-Alexandrium_andersonii.AAC.1